MNEKPQKHSYHIVDLKRQNHLKVGTNKPELKVKMQLVKPCVWPSNVRTLQRPFSQFRRRRNRSAKMPFHWNRLQ